MTILFQLAVMNQQSILQNAGKIQENKIMSKFEKGISGNPAGKIPGTLNKRTRLNRFLEPHAEPLSNKVIELALAGDINALRLCIERLVPKAKDDVINIVLPDLNGSTPQELTQEVLKAISGQQVSIVELKYVFDILKHFNSPGEDAEKKEIIEKANAFVDELRAKYEREY